MVQLTAQCSLIRNSASRVEVEYQNSSCHKRRHWSARARLELEISFETDCSGFIMPAPHLPYQTSLREQENKKAMGRGPTGYRESAQRNSNRAMTLFSSPGRLHPLCFSLSLSLSISVSLSVPCEAWKFCIYIQSTKGTRVGDRCLSSRPQPLQKSPSLCKVTDKHFLRCISRVRRALSPGRDALMGEPGDRLR